MRRSVKATALYFLAFAATAAPAQEAAPDPRGTPHAMVIASKVTLAPPAGDPVEVSVWARFEYRLDRSDAAAEVGLDKLALAIAQNGKPMQDSTISREAFRARPGPGAPPVEIPYDKAPPQLQEMLGLFGKTVATLTFDPADGKETGRDLKVKATPLAATIGGLVDSVLSVHARVPADKDRWEASAKLALAQGQMAAGVLSYEKAGPPDADGLLTVKVSGTLKAEGSIGASKIKDGVYKVTGEQVYDNGLGSWKSARWDVDMSYALTDAEDNPTGLAKGPLTLTVGAPKDVPESAPEPEAAAKP